MAKEPSAEGGHKIMDALHEWPRKQILEKGPHDDTIGTDVPSLNSASAEEIARVDFLNASLARAIVAARDARGGYHRWAELGEISGVKVNMIAELQRAFRLGTPQH